MNSIPVSLGKRSYEVIVGSRLIESLDRWIQTTVERPSAIALISDENVATHYEADVVASLTRLDIPVFTHRVPAGEPCKDLCVFENLQSRLIEDGLDRHSLMVALGGGALSDLTGFVAATFMRGIPFITLPTSLLSMVDASVGGKTAINLPAGKNLVGAFHQPSLVLIDIETLSSLPRREWASGMAEVIKMGMIMDADLFAELESRVAPGDEAFIIRRSVKAKADIVAKDERESGIREFLNLGHTFGHGIEKATGFARYTHGEAVALGLMAACRLAELKGHRVSSLLDRCATVLQAYELPHRCDVSPEAIFEGMKSDKKKKGNRLRFIVPQELARVEVRDDVTQAEVFDALKVLDA